MTFIDLKLELPDRLAREAKDAGLLTPRALAKLIREGVRREAYRRIAEGAERVRKSGLPEIPIEEIVAEVKAVRCEMREARQKRG